MGHKGRAESESEEDGRMQGHEKRLRIMFVDDDLEILPLYELAGEIEDTIITIQRGGLSALSFLHDLNYEVDAVILDLSMPDMDGITLTKQIRQNENLRSKASPIKIFWFTGWPFDKRNELDPIMQGAAESQVEKVYAKPLDPVQIIKDVKGRLAIGAAA
jgi:CheY-like chemotaxis protein